MQPDMSVWQGRDDTHHEGARALRWHQCVKPWHTAAVPGVVFLGFPCDEGVRRNKGRTGAAAAPLAIRRALAPFAWHHPHHVYDAGDVTVEGTELESAQEALSNRVACLLRENQNPLILGGGHETAWGTFLGLRPALPTSMLGIINLDAHFDLRSSPQANSGTPFAQMAAWSKQKALPFHYFCLGIAEEANTAALFERATELNTHWLTDLQLARMNEGEINRALQEFIGRVDALYLSIDVDVLPGNLMPAVSAPASFGVELPKVFSSIECIGNSGKLQAADIVEYNPSFDRHGRCAKTVARMVSHLIRHWSIGHLHDATAARR